MVRKVKFLSGGNFDIIDLNGNIVFKSRGEFLQINDKHFLLDAAGFPLVTFQLKFTSFHGRWRVFKGKSTQEKDFLFSVKCSSHFLTKAKLNVYLASNTTEQFSDFRIEGSWNQKSCVIYAGNSNDNIIAQMHKRPRTENIFIAKDRYGVTVYPNVDYAFIVVLIVILEQFNKPGA